MNGQAEQDKFVLNTLKFKQNGVFVEIGSNDPIHINNTYLLERDYNWSGIMIEYDKKWLPSYQVNRPNSIHVIQDATTINYKELFETNQLPSIIDYLQIDLEVDNESTLKTLKKLDNEILDTYTFSTITFEHDIYRGNFFNTREIARKIFAKRGYVPVFNDIHNEHPCYVYEDWYVHPDHVDMDYIETLKQLNENNYEPNTITGSSINWKNIIYP